MTLTLPQAALAVVTDAYAGVDLDALPDPTLDWWTSSIAESHPGKRFHTSSYCRKLDKVKHKTATVRLFTEVGPRVCGECFDPRSSSSHALLGHATHRTRTIAGELRKAAAAIDADDILRDLDTIERSLRVRRPVGTAEHADAARAAVVAYNGLRLLVTHQSGTSQRQAALCRVAAAGLVSRPATSAHNTTGRALDGQPYSAHDLGPLGGSGRYAPSLNDPYKAFLAALGDGATLTEARECAAAKALPVRDPNRIDQLPATIDLPAGATQIRLTDIVEVWRNQATVLVEAVLDEWVTLVETTLADHGDLGPLVVDVAPATTRANWALDAELKKYTDVYPYQVDDSSTSRRLEVPVVVAAWLERFAVLNKLSVRLEPSGDNTGAVLDTAARLRGDKAGTDAAMPLARALAAARGISGSAAA